MSILIKQTIRLDFEDLRWLRSQYPRLGYNRIIRALVRRHRREVESKYGTGITDSDLAELGDSIDPDSVGSDEAQSGGLD